MTRITGGRGRDTLRGTRSADLLDGRGGDDRLLGGDGDDLLLGGAGDDFLDGGAGLDTVRLQVGSSVNLGSGLVYDAFDPEDATEVDSLVRVEAVLGSAAADFVLGSTRADRIDGGGGDDVVAGRDGDDDLSGGAGGDALGGGRGRDRIAGDAGDDSLEGGEGDDRLFGGDGSDTLFGDGGADLLDGGRGSDFLRPGAGGGDTLVMGSDAADLAVLVYFGPDPSADAIGATTVRGFAAGPAPRHVLQVELTDYLPDGRRLASANGRDFLDSDDDGRITAADREVRRDGRDLVLDLDAVLARAFGPGDYGRQEVRLEGAGGGFAAARIDPALVAGLVVTEEGVVAAAVV
ncbi:MAG TPA: hypothetical protein VF606_13340 [Geminicoccaceae bacterium]